MAINDITLTASMRNNLLSLQNTNSLLDRTQERLSTGKKVNSALDNPSSYFTAQSLNARASDLNNLLDSMGQAVQTIKAADEGITTLTSLVEQAKSTTEQAAITANKTTLQLEGVTSPITADPPDDLVITINDVDHTVTLAKDDDLEGIVTKINEQFATDGIEEDALASVNGTGITINSKSGYSISVAENADLGITAVNIDNSLKTYEAQFNGILKQIDELVQDTSYKGINLLNGDDLTVNFNELRTSTLTIEGVTFDSAGLKLTAAENWNSDNNLNTSMTQTEAAINTLREQASTFGQNLSVVQTRQDFTESMINILTSGADALTLADMNEEAANMLALQTRQALGTNALSMASQAEQSVLKLFS